MKRRAARAGAAQGQEAVYLRLRTDEIYGGRPLRGKRADVTALAASIARHGLLSPVVVQKNARAGRYALVCGARRLAACRLLGVKEIDARLLEGDAWDALACFLEEHWCREAFSCFDEAALLERADEGEVARRFALPEKALLRRLRLLLLGRRVLAYARETGLTLDQAEPLFMIPDETRRLEAASIIAQRDLHGRAARRLAAGERGESDTGGAGKRRAMRGALGALSAVCERLRASGMDASLSVRSMEGGLCVQIALKNGENARAGQEIGQAEANPYIDSCCHSFPAGKEEGEGHVHDHHGFLRRSGP